MNETNPCMNCRYDLLRKREKELKLSVSNANLLIPSYAYLMKLAAGRIKWKIENCKKHPHGEIKLGKQDIKHLHILQGKIDQYLQETLIDMNGKSPLKECFSKSSEDDALDYFDKNLSKKEISDTYGEKIFISPESYPFMYKEDATGKHIFDSKNYEEERGKRLPYIPMVICSSKCIFERPYRYDKTGCIFDRMYLHSFREKYSGTDENIVFMAVIVLRDRKKNKPTTFKTAFPIVGDMDLCRRLSGGYSFVEKK